MLILVDTVFICEMRFLFICAHLCHLWIISSSIWDIETCA
jgi:hypothetical protein